MAFNLGEFEVDPESGEYRQVNRESSQNSDDNENKAKNPFAGMQRPNRPEREHKPRKQRTKGNRMISSVVITLIFAFLYFYIELPALNIHSPDLYMFIILTCAVFCISELLLGGFRGDSAKSYVSEMQKRTKIPFYIICGCIVVTIVGSILGMQMLRAKSYAALLDVEDGDFATEVSEISFSNIPMLDSDSANVLANRKLGELSDLVSQFEVHNESYQIDYNGSPVRVTYLEYGDIFKWWQNQSDGLPAYIVIDMVTEEVTVERLDEGIKYSPSEYFFRDIDRYLRFNYPTKIFTDVNFEIDDEGNPYWVASVATMTIGLFGGEDIIGAVLVNAVTGESEYYEIDEIPAWVDRVYTSELIVEQYNYYGLYESGFINSMFGQSGCTTTTSGYNYIVQDGDVWLYTGITSVGSDQGNIGFILVNQRTKEAKYYACAGAEEYSAMSSAEGAVQQYSYDATFPLLLNINGQATYFMALKDDSDLVKMYAMVNVSQYQIVATGSSVTECAANYEELLLEKGLIDGLTEESVEGTETITGVITDIRSAVQSGNTYYYIQLEGADVYYSASAIGSPETIIMDIGDKITISYVASEDSIISASKITFA